jgi:shikimate dehydrogenase
MKSKELQIYGIVGNSLANTLSPDIYNYLYETHHLPCLYQKFEVNKASLPAAVKGIRALGIYGVNVTFPYKRSITKYIDEFDQSSIEVGTVNIIKRINSHLIGYNTDIDGLRAALLERLNINLRGKNIVVLGSGGAAREVLYVLSEIKPGCIIILSRNRRKAESIIQELDRITCEIKIIIGNRFSRPDMSSVNNIDLIINATSANPDLISSLLNQISETGILGDTSYFDLNYGSRAVRNNIPTEINKYDDGLFMLAAQASMNFRIWHGKSADIESIYLYLKKVIRR